MPPQPNRDSSHQSSKKGILVRVAIILIAVIAALIGKYPSEFKAAIKTTFIQTTLMGNNQWGLSLIKSGFSGDKPLFELDIGYSNELTMKFIYLSRYFMQDQFLFESWANDVLTRIKDRLEKQYQANNWTEETLTTPVPVIEWGSLTPEEFYTQYVKPGKVVVLRHVPSKAAELWTTQYFAEHYGNHIVDVINTTAISPAPPMPLREFIQASTVLSQHYDDEEGTDKKEEETREEDGKEKGKEEEVNSDYQKPKNPSTAPSLYLRSLSDIFDHYPQLLDELNPHLLDPYIKGQYMTAQIFMGTKQPGSGTSYHCANFNNLFYMIEVRFESLQLYLWLQGSCVILCFYIAM